MGPDDAGLIGWCGFCKLTSAGRPFGSLTRGLVEVRFGRMPTPASRISQPRGWENVPTRDYRRSSLEALETEMFGSAIEVRTPQQLFDQLGTSRPYLARPRICQPRCPSAGDPSPSPSSSLPASGFFDQRHAQPRGHGLQHAACSVTMNEGR